MSDEKIRGGEPGGARLLELARAELLNELLPQLDGDARYRARLIANAMKIALRELEVTGLSGAEDTQAARKLAERLEAALAHSRLPPETTLRDALRQGALDGDAALYDALVALAQARRRLLDE